MFWSRDVTRPSFVSLDLHKDTGSLTVTSVDGWDSETFKVPEEVDAQIAQAFYNVQPALATAGVQGGWSSVFSVESYHVGGPGDQEEVFKAMKKNFNKWMPNHKPRWTLLGVARLGLAEVKVEIDVVAWEK